jgi:hypothetical protein
MDVATAHINDAISVEKKRTITHKSSVFAALENINHFGFVLPK